MPTPNEPDGVSLLYHVERVLREADSKHEVRFAELAKAVQIAETTTAESFKKHNDLLNMIRERDEKYARKEDLNSINKRVDEQGSRVYWLMGVAAAAGTAAGAVAAKVI